MAFFVTIFFAAAAFGVCAETVSAITEQSVDPFGTFAGSGAGAVNTASGDYNAFFGYRTGNANIDGDYNTFFGAGAGRENIHSGGNTFIGGEAGRWNMSGTHNTFAGQAAGEGLTGGNYNTFIGDHAGHTSDGDGNVLIGSQAGLNEHGSNKFHISISGTTPLVYGEFDNQLVQINGALVFPSDERMKKNIGPLKASLDKVMRLNGVSYELKGQAGPGKGKNIGFIAQEVETVLPELVHSGSGGYKALSYDRFAPLLVEAIKEQQALIKKQKERLLSENLIAEARQRELDELDAVIKDLISQLSALRAEVNKLKSRDLTAQK